MNAAQIPGFLHKDRSNKCLFFLRSTLHIFFFLNEHTHMLRWKLWVHILICL